MVPESMVKTLLPGKHGDMLYGHEEQTKTKERILQSYWWRGMDQDISDFLSKCDKCQKIKKFKHETKNSLIPLPTMFRTKPKNSHGPLWTTLNIRK
jgi:hypothetical protein